MAAYTRVGLPLAGALAGPAWVHTGRFLGPSIERFWNAYPLDTVLRCGPTPVWSASARGA